MANVSDIMQRDFLSFDASTRITEVIGKLQQEDERYAVIFDKKFKPPYRGILDRVLLIESKMDPKAEIGNYVMHPPIVSEDTDVFKAAELMYHSYPCLLPVMKKDKIIGVVRSRDILSLLPKMPELAKLRVKEIEGNGLIVFQYESRLGDAMNIMREKHFTHIPIVDKAGKIISLLSLTDVFEKHFLKSEGKRQGFSKGRRDGGTFSGPKAFEATRDIMLDQPVGDIASTIVFTVSPTDSLGKAVAEMFEHKISDLVIAQDRTPVGIITTRDLLETFSRLKKSEFWGIQFYGCEGLPGQLYDAVREQVAEFYERVKRNFFKDIIYFLVQIKQYEKKDVGNKVKYSVHLRMAVPSRVFNADCAHFDLNTAISWALKAMNQEVLSFKEKGKKFWTTTGRKGKRQELGKLKREEIESRGNFIRSKLVKR